MDPTSNPTNPRCHVPWQQMVIDSTGTVAPCCYWGAYGNANPPVGNINENTLEEIWNGEGYQRLRKNMAKGDLEAAGCSACFAIKQGHALGLQQAPDAAAESPPQTEHAKHLAVLRDEIARGAACLASRPTVVSLTPSHFCNFRCV